jgi:hypothetical protein
MHAYPAKTVMSPSMMVERGGNLPRHKRATAIGVARSIRRWGVLESARKSLNCSDLTDDCTFIWAFVLIPLFALLRK